MCIRDRGNPYTVEVPYNYYILHVDLENFNLSHVPVYIMGEEHLSMYAMYTVSYTHLDVYKRQKNRLLPEVEHSYPDYSIYPQFFGIAYGFLSRGCPVSYKHLDVYKRQ